MIRTTIAAAAIALASTASAFAAGMATCDEASMMKTEEMAKGMTDPMKKDQMMMATQEIDSAKMAMKAGKMDECSTHMDNAMKAMETK
ncbi:MULTISPECIES: hypothetical protein [unclassified Rhizobium]|uniref:hypothetical protein n=1 Tax=unclassified Rhizobium TaxID=2613769 RepID=UPI0006FFD540|nr:MULTISPECIES: hypothetical protein [unclassified Rhizobium]KQV35681.1 hypothetical protein ASC86_10770 [Rhizobium sp. Root1212]KRD25788.1 hypothetical protein ASE37_10765 [Rhizobium sp. Root268]